MADPLLAWLRLLFVWFKSVACFFAYFNVLAGVYETLIELGLVWFLDVAARVDEEVVFLLLPLGFDAREIYLFSKQPLQFLLLMLSFRHRGSFRIGFAISASVESRKNHFVV